MREMERDENENGKKLNVRIISSEYFLSTLLLLFLGWFWTRNNDYFGWRSRNDGDVENEEENGGDQDQETNETEVKGVWSKVEMERE